MILYQVVPRHLILQMILPLNISKSQNQVNYKKIKPLLGKSKKILFEK